MTVTSINAATTHRPAFGLIRSEWIKLWTLTSNKILLTVSLLGTAASALLTSIALAQRANDPDPSKHIATVTPASFADNVLWLQLLFAVIAVLFATTEYDTGQIIPTLLATPSRIPVPLAKGLIVAATGFAIGVTSVTVGLMTPLAILSGTSVSYTVSFGDVTSLALDSGLYLAGIGIVAFAIAVLVKNVVVAILTPIMLFTIVPAILAWAGGSVLRTMSGYFPTIAGREVISPHQNPAGLNGAEGLLILAIWAIVGLVIAGVAYRRRDA